MKIDESNVYRLKAYDVVLKCHIVAFSKEEALAKAFDFIKVEQSLDNEVTGMYIDSCEEAPPPPKYALGAGFSPVESRKLSPVEEVVQILKTCPGFSERLSPEQQVIASNVPPEAETFGKQWNEGEPKKLSFDEAKNFSAEAIAILLRIRMEFKEIDSQAALDQIKEYYEFFQDDHGRLIVATDEAEDIGYWIQEKGEWVCESDLDDDDE